MMFQYNERVRVKDDVDAFAGEIGFTIEDSDARGWVTLYLPSLVAEGCEFTDFRVDELEPIR
jgi:hypothetical protein